MKPRICICCGEPMEQVGNTLSRNPNICASCSSLVDGMEEGIPVTLFSAPPLPTPEGDPSDQGTPLHEPKTVE